jgi:cellulose synthase (UDP-forming)
MFDVTPRRGNGSVFRAVRAWLADLTGRRAYRRHLDREDRVRRIRAQVTAVGGGVATLVYVGWLLTVLNMDVWWLGLPFILAELVALGVYVSFFAVSWYPRYHRPEGMPVDSSVYTVDVLVTTCGEPYEVVARTLREAVAIHYEKKRVWVLDDKADNRLQELARQLDCGYLARPTREHAKAGNLNYGLARTTGDLVLTLDADQVPDRRIIRSLIGYFELPYVGFVQTKQRFDVPAGDPFSNSDPIFYDLMQSGKDGSNAAFSCGSGVMYRRDALKQVRGFSTWNLVEDVHTSLKLHDAGWRSVYHNHALTTGTAPTNIWDIYKQRYQWAADSLRLFFWDDPFARRGLSPMQRFQYAHLGIVYLFAGFVMPFFYVLPVVSLFTGTYVLTATVATYLAFRLPSLVLTDVAYRFQFSAARSSVDFARAGNVWLGYFPAFIAATFTALRTRSRRPRYTVTPKDRARRPSRPQWLGILPQGALILASLAAIPYGAWVYRGSIDLVLLNSAWSLWTVQKLWPLCWAVLRSSRAR